jgi:hypothetical protein
VQNINKENMFDPDLESVEFQALKFTEFLIGRVYFLFASGELIFSNFFSSGGVFSCPSGQAGVTFLRCSKKVTNQIVKSLQSLD